MVEDLFLKFKSLHMKFEITPSSASYEKLITYCCDLHKVHFALDIVDQMCEEGLSLSIEMLHSILHASEENYEYNLVRRIYSLIGCHNVKPTRETFRSMINLSVKMKDFNGAYAMLDDLKKLNIRPTSTIYNTILAGYFRESNISGAMMVLKQMESEDVKPDSHTYSYLIANCNCEEDITKYYKAMMAAGIQVTKHIFMALINAYTACGQIEKAKQVFSVIAERQPNDLQIGLALLQAMKDELGLTPSRKSLDFLLASCVSAKDLQSSLLIWREYQAAGLRCNILTFLRMYQALLASGDPKSAKTLLTKIPTEDPHVRCIIKACQMTYVQSTSSKMKKQKVQKKNKT